MSEKNRDHRQEEGFALILAILSLMLLTFLGLALATTTSTELRIATNYRWNMQALYNAEAGVEVGKRVLQSLNWDSALPAYTRGAWTALTANPTAQCSNCNPPGGKSASLRNWEMWDCDKQGNGVGYGVVLWDKTDAYENVTTAPNLPSVAGTTLNGAFTLWIRRPLQAVAGGKYQDNPAADNLILTAEGVAPYTTTLGSGALARNNQARRLIEVSLRRQDQPAPCDTRGGQIGGGPEGNNVFGGPCSGLDVNNALDNVTFAPGDKHRFTP
jgi:Tfp pilus assembly protein PilX